MAARRPPRKKSPSKVDDSLNLRGDDQVEPLDDETNALGEDFPQDDQVVAKQLIVAAECFRLTSCCAHEGRTRRLEVHQSAEQEAASLTVSISFSKTLRRS